jgi:hypothetical protein
MKILFRHPRGEKWEHLSHTNYTEETKLRDILHQDPNIIPVEDVSSDTELSPIKLMLKEVGLPGSGSTDLVGIDKNGNIFILETKLATNPEAKRTVIGQILEYAAFLHKRELDWLDATVRKEKNGIGIAQYFEQEPEWDKETFEQKLQDNLNQGTFKLFIVVDEMNPELQRTINYLNNVLRVDIYALELRYFKEKAGIEILVPNVHGRKKQVTSAPPAPQWTEARFLEDAKIKVDEETQRTLRKLYDFSRILGNVDFGSGRTIGTFRVRLPHKAESINLYVISSRGRRSWFGFKSMVQKGVDKALILEYVKQLKSLGFPFDETKHVEAYPEFDVAILNDEEKLSAFEKHTIELKEKLQKQ